MEKWIDLRSDTVTLPPQEMKLTMIHAELGDDVYEDDPTVKKLERLAAEMLGKEAALFVPSGTFGNQLSLLTHTKRGDEVIIASEAHIWAHEVGASAVIAGVQLRSFDIESYCRLPINKIESLIREDDIHYPETGLICMENALGNGSVIGLKDMESVWELGQKHNVPIHLDGARIFNAATALNVDVKEIAKWADSVNVCLSKGLCAPVGSVLVGTSSFITRARKMRKLMGGGLRQAGVIAAPCIYALENMVDRLKDDHDNAQYLAKQLAELEHVEVVNKNPDINMVFFKISKDIVSEQKLIHTLYEKKIKINGMEDEMYRFVTHFGIEKEDIDKTVSLLAEIMK